MALMLSVTYEAFLEAGVSEAKARAAAQEVAALDHRLNRIESKLDSNVTLTKINLALTLLILAAIVGAAVTLLTGKI